MRSQAGLTADLLHVDPNDKAVLDSVDKPD